MLELLPINNRNITNRSSFLSELTELDNAIGSLFPDTWGSDDRWDETDSCYIYQLNLPGYRKEEVKVNLINNKLSISAISKRNGNEKRFYREVYLADNVIDISKGTAKLEDGVLSVVFPKTERAKGREIKVE